MPARSNTTPYLLHFIVVLLPRALLCLCQRWQTPGLVPEAAACFLVYNQQRSGEEHECAAQRLAGSSMVCLKSVFRTATFLTR